MLPILTYLRRVWTERRVRVLSVDPARARNELTYLEECWAEDSRNQRLHYAILDERDRIRELEELRAKVEATLAPVG